jgi:glycosyltransferase involved in cell wall biosynthesis
MRIGYLMQHGVEIRRPPYDGPGSHVREVVRELEQRGHEVCVLLRLDDQIWQSRDLTAFRPVPVVWMDKGPLRLFERTVRRIQYELQLPYAALFESLRFGLACRQSLPGFDLLYERMSWVGYGGALAARWLNVPLVLENNGDQLADLEAKGIAPQGLQRRLSRALVAWTVRQASHVVVSGDGWRKAFVERWGTESDRVTTVENGTSLVADLDRTQLRSFQEPASDTTAVTLVYLGGFQPWQGVPILIKATARAIKQGSSIRLVLVGSGTGSDDAQQMVADQGLESHVTFAGQMAADAYGSLLASADIGVAPYCGWPEFSGLKLFDYKAAGLAVIASGQNGQPATLQHGHSGWIVPPCDEEALATAIVRLASDPHLRRRLGQAARAEAESCHRWSDTAERLEQVFAGVTDKRTA